MNKIMYNKIHIGGLDEKIKDIDDLVKPTIKSNNDEEFLDTFITTIDNKIQKLISINNIKLQNGGNNINKYYFKYLKYKIKYHNLINI